MPCNLFLISSLDNTYNLIIMEGVMKKIIEPDYGLRLRIVAKFQTARNFGDYLGVHETRVSQIVNRRIRSSKMEANKWAKALNCKVEDIFPEMAD